MPRQSNHADQGNIYTALFYLKNKLVVENIRLY